MQALSQFTQQALEARARNVAPNVVRWSTNLADCKTHLYRTLVWHHELTMKKLSCLAW